jgi:4-hydroxy-3-polyprenylbenzoate decarboxylase
LKELVLAGHSIYISITSDGLSIMRDETGIQLSGSDKDIQAALEKHLSAKAGQITYFNENNMYSPIASGSVRIDAMVVVPCSMKTLASIANGFASNLIERAADVMIKEKRKLIIVPRETPLSAIHLRNMLSLAELGVHVIPAMPAFYHAPKQVSDMVDFVAARILDSLGVENRLSPRWMEK